MIDLDRFDIRHRAGNVRLICKACAWEKVVDDANLGDVTRAADEHVRRKRRALGAYCAAHRCNHDEQQAEQGDRCIDCGRDRPEHQNQCHKCGAQRVYPDEVAWRKHRFCSFECLAKARAEGVDTGLSGRCA